MEPNLPRRAADPRYLHKGTFGRVLVVGGSRGLAGAARLAAEGAHVTGAGYVSVLVPKPVEAQVAANPALQVQGLPATAHGTVAYPALRQIRREAAASTAGILGPGLGRHPGTDALACRWIGEAPGPWVVDADALNAWAAVSAGQGPVHHPRLWTPHPGEAARLLGCSVGEVQRDRDTALTRLCRLLGGVVVLKGHGTLIGSEDRRVINPTGNSILAKGGTGDVLAGIIGSFLAQGRSPFDAAQAAVWVHGRAADILRETVPDRGLTFPAFSRSLVAALDLMVGMDFFGHA